MTTSTTSANAGEKQKKTRRGVRLWAVAVWVIVWQLAAMALGQEILLVSPVSVLFRLAQLLPHWDFWSAILFSFWRITLGFLAACLVGTVLAVLSSRFSPVRDLTAPLMSVVKSIPVASFIILVLIWVPSRNLSVVISFLMVTPIVYANVLGGISSMDHKLTQMADVFQVPFPRRLRYLYLPQVAPFFRSACAVGLGLCWKAGIAAEVIGLPDGSIGERLYEAKVYLATQDLFSWTVVIVLVSLVFEKCFLFLLDRAVTRLEQS